MKNKKLKEILNMLPDDLDINYCSGHGFQEITCLINDKTVCLSNAPYMMENEIDKLTMETIVKCNLKK